MSERIKVALSSEFLTSVASLPRDVQRRVAVWANRFRNDPDAIASTLAAIPNALDPKMALAPFDDGYAAVVARDESGTACLALYAGSVDAAQEWGARKRCAVNERTGALQVYDGAPDVEKTRGRRTAALFAEVPDESLLALGVPEEQLALTRSLKNADAFARRRDAFPPDAAEALSWLVEGEPLEEVLKAYGREDSQSCARTVARALEGARTLASFTVVEGEDELLRMMAAPLEKWRVFLHPTQRRAVERDYSGPALVLGCAGSGKTVVALHRAKRLASQLRDRERILFTTFTANLATDIRARLRQICPAAEMKKIDVVHFDAWVAQYLRENGYRARLVYGDELYELWEQAARAADLKGEYSVEFYMEEYDRVVAAQEAFTREKYFAASRTGRGTGLDRKKRAQIWKVFEKYQTLMKERNCRDINTAAYECRALATRPNQTPRYRHIIVDEAQDLSPNAFRLLRALAGPEGPNDLFIVGDSRQRIYKNRAVLSQCGVNVRGRSSRLRVNYRTTAEIRRTALALITGLSFDNLDDALEPEESCVSLTHGAPPEIRVYKSANEELDAVVARIRELVDAGVPRGNLCVVARTKSLLEPFATALDDAGFGSYRIRTDRSDELDRDGVRLATLHRVKGLEFQYVFVVSVNKNVVPLASALDRTDDVSYEEGLAAERRLLYVAITRAQKGAWLSACGKPSEFLDVLRRG